jgi:hypothetical protein
MEYLRASGTTPIYVYFDLKRGQTVDKLTASFLKQIAWPPEMEFQHVKSYTKLSI